MRWLSTEDAKDEIAVDTEGTGLVIGKDRVKLVQVGGFTHGWAIPWHSWNGLFAEIVKKYEGRWIMHNSKYDAGMLSNQGETSVHIPRHKIDDTRVMSHVREPHMSTALKNQATRWVDPLAAGLQTNLKETKWTWETVPWDYGPYWQYGALDTVLTRHLKDVHYPFIMADAPDAYYLENSVTWTLEKMERRGAHIDVPYAREKFRAFLTFVEESERWIWDHYKVKAGSNAAIIEILEREGYVFTKATASGAKALDKEVLGHIDHPLAQTVLQRRQLQKLANTYLKHFIEEVDSDDCIHHSINSLGARTSRMSMERPNLQNLPRKSEANPAATTVRNSVSARPGHTLLMCDFDQIEMRLLAHLSSDPGLIAAFHSPNDFFVELARSMFDDPTLEKKDKRRQITKNAGYAKIYGAGIAKFALTAGVPEQTARAVMSRWDSLYPGTKRFSKAVESVAWQRQRDEGVGYARSLLTKRRQVADQNKIYALVNYLIQGSAAEVFKSKILELDAAGLGDWMIAPVHDEIILDVPNENLEDAVHTLEKVMNDHKSFSVPITASVSYGPRWGEKTDWDTIEGSVLADATAISGKKEITS